MAEAMIIRALDRFTSLRTSGAKERHGVGYFIVAAFRLFRSVSLSNAGPQICAMSREEFGEYIRRHAELWYF